MSKIIPFEFESHALRVNLDAAGEPWFNATDVCQVLELGNPSQAIKTHVDGDDLQKMDVIDNLGRTQRANLRLAAIGFQQRNDRDEWELTEKGRAWVKALPYSRNGHSGYQILWNPAVLDQMKEAA